MSLSLKLVHGDIVVAKFCISPIVNLFNDESLYTYAAYHAQQATEKCLKIILNQYYGIPDTNKRYRSHIIPDLLDYLNECETISGKSIPIDIPQIIDIESVRITSWEANSRYHDNMVLLRKTITEVLNACDKMYRELLQNGFQ